MRAREQRGAAQRGAGQEHRNAGAARHGAEAARRALHFGRVSPYTQPMRLHHPVMPYVYSTAPLLLLLAATSLTIGTGEAVTAFYASYRTAHPALTAFIQVLTDWGNPALYLVYGTLYLRASKTADPATRRFVIAYIVVQLLVAFLFVRILKIVIGKPRPGIGGDFSPFSFNAGNNSFPSGHTAEIAGAIIPLAQRWRNVALTVLLSCYLAAVGYSRVYLGMHHMSDVLAGTGLGCAAAYLIHRLAHRTTS